MPRSPAMSERILVPNQTCCGIAVADRSAVLIDNQAYFSAAAAAIQNARHSIWVLGWEFDPRTALKPTEAEGEQEQIGALLKRVADEQPQLRQPRRLGPRR